MIQPVKEYIIRTCKCFNKNVNPYSAYLSDKYASMYRMQMDELENEHHDLPILALINANHYSNDFQGHKSKNEETKRVKLHCLFLPRPSYIW